MFDQILLNFPKQFEWQPEVINAQKLTPKERVVVLGMGGSHLAADILKTWAPYAEKLTIHSDYGLPLLPEVDLNKSLIIAVSHSGNTEEVLDSLKLAQENGLATAIITLGGQLIEFAQKNSLPYITIPDSAVQPRFALGFHFRAILKIMGEDGVLSETSELARTLESKKNENEGQILAQKIKGRVPVIYSSTRKSAVASIWKIKLNETAKTPAFYNVIPEANHNELAGFADSAMAKELTGKFFFIFLEDSYDEPQNQKRIMAMADLYQSVGFSVEKIKMAGLNHWHKIFSTLLLADWTSYYLAELYGLDPEKVTSVEYFKKKLAGL